MYRARGSRCSALRDSTFGIVGSRADIVAHTWDNRVESPTKAMGRAMTTLTARNIVLSAFALVAVLLVATPGSAQSVETFFGGKRIRLIVGSNPGGAYDVFARVMTPYNVAPKDGLVIALVERGAAMSPSGWGPSLATAARPMCSGAASRDGPVPGVLCRWWFECCGSKHKM
jgi:hypothetical protein